MDDEQVDPDAIGEGQRGAHAEEVAVGVALLGECPVDLSEVLTDPLEQLPRLFLVDLKTPLGRLVNDFSPVVMASRLATSPAAIPPMPSATIIA